MRNIFYTRTSVVIWVELVRNLVAHSDARVGDVKGKLANGVGSQYSHATSERGVSSVTQADAHTSAASSRLNWRPHQFKWSRPFRGKTKSGFFACAITFRTSYTTLMFSACRIKSKSWSNSQWNLSYNAETSVSVYDWWLEESWYAIELERRKLL